MKAPEAVVTGIPEASNSFPMPISSFQTVKTQLKGILQVGQRKRHGNVGLLGTANSQRPTRGKSAKEEQWVGLGILVEQGRSVFQPKFVGGVALFAAQPFFADGGKVTALHVDGIFRSQEFSPSSSSNNKLLGTSASLLVTSALLLVTRSY